MRWHIANLDVYPAVVRPEVWESGVLLAPKSSRPAGDPGRGDLFAGASGAPAGRGTDVSSGCLSSSLSLPEMKARLRSRQTKTEETCLLMRTRTPKEFVAPAQHRACMRCGRI